jgi:hypothetical protein
LHALRLICDGLLLGPLRGRDASTEVLQGLIRNVDVEGADLDAGLDGGAYDDLPSSRSELNEARTSVEKSSGSSQAAKCPPLSTSLK